MSDPSLAGKRIIVGGGTGDVGIGIVEILLAAGADVIVPARNIAKATASFADLEGRERLVVLDTFPTDDVGVLELRRAFASHGPIDGAVASLGPWFSGPNLVDLPAHDWWAMATASLASHFFFAKAAVPSLINGGQYIMINGAAALAPVPHSGVVSIMAAAQQMLGQVLKSENPHLRLHTLMLSSIIATRARAKHDPSWVTPSDIGAVIAWLLSEHGKLTAGTIITLTPKHKSSAAERRASS